MELVRHGAEPPSSIGTAGVRVVSGDSFLNWQEYEFGIQVIDLLGVEDRRADEYDSRDRQATWPMRSEQRRLGHERQSALSPENRQFDPLEMAYEKARGAAIEQLRYGQSPHRAPLDNEMACFVPVDQGQLQAVV